MSRKTNLVAFTALRLEFEAVFAFHVAGQTLKNWREKETVTADTF
jgi:hypothetical protein